MAAYPKDQFDQLPEDLTRVGAHRGPKKRGGGWVGFAWALLATGVLVFGGLYGLSRYMGIEIGLPIFASTPTPTATPTPTPTAEPILDPNTDEFKARQLKVTVLNGTPVAGLQNTVGDALSGLGWVVDSRTSAATRDVEETTVYYDNAANEDAARGLVVALGAGTIREVDPGTFPGAPLNIVIGADYPGATATP